MRPGERYAGAPALHRLLLGYGDLPAGTPAPADRYDGALASGVARFQRRHGLAADGVLGPATLAALAVPLGAARAPDRAGAGAAALAAAISATSASSRSTSRCSACGRWDPVAARRRPRSARAVIVGRALNTQTPVFVEEMRYVIFRPYWNVPPSILRKEILPALARDPDYLRRHDMEIVRGQGDDAAPVALDRGEPRTAAAGQLRVRQRPGPRNALGLVKFVFPNDANVYLHGTPAPALFSRARRDFSHGCVRVEDPVGARASGCCADQPEWTRDAHLGGDGRPGTSLRVDLARPLRVILFYVTAVVMPEDGAMHFADDIYGHDARLASALAARRPPPADAYQARTRPVSTCTKSDAA